MGNLVIIGPRSSGKTTYLCALAYWPQRQAALHHQSIFDVDPIGEDSENLQKQAKNVIMPQESLQGTKVLTFSEMAQYQFQIKVKKKFSNKTELINLVVRDSAGELFDNLASGNINPDHEEIYQDFLRKDVVGCLILLGDWQKEDDEDYSASIKNFLSFLDQYDRNHDLKIALAMSKCERGELWTGRIDPYLDIFGAHLSQTRLVLEKSNFNQKNLEFFAISTFGVLARNDPRPNRRDEPGKKGKWSVLREPQKWKPYNLIAPLYWLSTGKKLGANV